MSSKRGSVSTEIALMYPDDNEDIFGIHFTHMKLYREISCIHMNCNIWLILDACNFFHKYKIVSIVWNSFLIILWIDHFLCVQLLEPLMNTKVYIINDFFNERFGISLKNNYFLTAGTVQVKNRHLFEPLFLLWLTRTRGFCCSLHGPDICKIITWEKQVAEKVDLIT